MEAVKDSSNTDVTSLSDRIFRMEKAKVLQFDRSNKKYLRQNGKGVKFSTVTPDVKTILKKEVSKMATFSTDSSGMPSFINTGSGDGGLGGGGLLGTLLAVSLLGRGGLGGLGGATEAVTSNLNANTLDGIQNVLGDIKASVPLAEGQVQLALAATLAQLTNQNNANTHTIQAGQTAAALTASTNAALAARDAAAIMNLTSHEAGDTRATVVASEARIVALITANQIAELNRIASERQDEIIELRSSNARDRDRSSIEITMNNNQNQNQLQFQQQSQIMGQLAGVLGNMQQSIHATNQAINIGSGMLRTNPTNNNTNVTA